MRRQQTKALGQPSLGRHCRASRADFTVSIAKRPLGTGNNYRRHGCDSVWV
jgi:hypothetical protein